MRNRRKLQGGRQMRAGAANPPEQASLEPTALKPAGGACFWELLRWEGLQCTPPTHGRRPPSVEHPVRLGAFMSSCQLGPTSPPCPTWWSPTFHDPRMTHVDLAPHLASIWGWHSSGGGHIWQGNRQIPMGPVTPREGSVSLCNSPPCAAGWLASCSLELRVMLGGAGLASPSQHHQLPPSLSRGPTTSLAPWAALPLGDSPQGTPLTSALTLKPQKSQHAADMRTSSLRRG